MQSIDWARLTAVCTRRLGEDVLYRPAAGGEYRIRGVFDSAYRELSMGREDTPIAAGSPVLGMQPGDVPVPLAKGDRLVIVSSGGAYTVTEVRPDSHGGAILMLIGGAP
jgi:hypothetical protein